MQNKSVYPKSTRDECRFPCSGFRAIPRSTSNKTSGLTFFRRFQRFPELPVLSLEEHQFQHTKLSKAPCSAYLVEMRSDSLALTEEESQLSTRTSRGEFPQQLLCERKPEFAASSGMNTKMPWFKRSSDYPVMAWIQGHLSCHKMKGCLNPLWST